MKTSTKVKTFWCIWILGAILFALAGCTAAPASPATDQAPAATEPSITDETPATGAETPTEVGPSPTEAGAAATEVGGPATEAVEATQELPNTGANIVQVELKEYVVDMPASIPAGQTVFEVTNVGTEEHSFEIEGQGIEAELERHLQPGETLTLEVDLAPGAYEVYCTVSDHREEGMSLDLTVTAP